jgi:hypothetical protein
MLRLGVALLCGSVLAHRFALSQAVGPLAQLAGSRNYYVRHSRVTRTTPRADVRCRMATPFYLRAASVPEVGAQCRMFTACIRRTIERLKRPVYIREQVMELGGRVQHDTRFAESHYPSCSLGSMVHGNVSSSKKTAPPATLPNEAPITFLNFPIKSIKIRYRLYPIIQSATIVQCAGKRVPKCMRPRVLASDLFVCVRCASAAAHHARRCHRVSNFGTGRCRVHHFARRACRAVDLRTTDAA